MRKTLLTLIATLFALNAWSQQKLYINGELAQEKSVVSMSFSGDMVTLTLKDATTETYDMSTVVIELADEATGLRSNVKSTATLHKSVDGTLTIAGMEPGQPISVFSISGRKEMEQSATSGETTLNVGHLGRGLYILRVGDTIIKFTKE